MPTPSSNQPPNPTSPPPYAFPTCPDDQPHPPSRQIDDPARQGAGDMEVRSSPSTIVASPTTYSSDASRGGLATDDIIGFSDPEPVEPSSRSATVSPRPPSSGTMAPSPPSTGPDGDDSLKHQADEHNLYLSRESSTTIGSVQMLTPNSTGMSDSLYANAEVDEYSSPSMGSDYSCRRTIPISPSSYLRPGSKFHGTQQSERQVYEVQVEIKHVDMRESFLCGYLRIQGLTEDHPTLTTYFEGEIIGSKYNFYTQHDDWGANTKVDLNHWSKFGAFRPYSKLARKGPTPIPDNAQKEHIFMRWKEHFLVPDHRVRTITGASFEGFYYICFNQLRGKSAGSTFILRARSKLLQLHYLRLAPPSMALEAYNATSRFQQLELKHVPDRGCFSALEFR
ncbi:Glucose-induced degradation-like protein [Cladobotryum mycophilum]|uniref:Glucose-induced degradation-like protein n=1 Tax=Cladobotryum mycophilum TaxID=491253 RepID=A0ABR0SWW3_9HYPO